MNDVEKLRALLPHWMEHNQEHAGEFEAWAERANAAGHEATAEAIRRAAEAMRQSNEALQLALDELGGPAAHHHGHLHAH
jgi:hypothetical protein